jgi:hypothetical protein
MPGQYAAYTAVWPRPVRSYGFHHGLLGVPLVPCVVFFGFFGLRGGIAPPANGFFGTHQPIRLYESMLLLNGEAIEPDELA